MKTKKDNNSEINKKPNKKIKPKTPVESSDDGVNILIRKYDNRRLYSVNHKSYINLEDISSYLNEGKKITVVEVATERNITCDILLQILLQQGKADLIPQEILEVMVKMNNAWLKKFWTPYFDKSIRLAFDLNPLLSLSTKDIFKNWFGK